VLPAPGAGAKCPPVLGAGIAAAAVTALCGAPEPQTPLLVLLGLASSGWGAESRGAGGLGHKKIEWLDTKKVGATTVRNDRSMPLV